MKKGFLALAGILLFISCGGGAGKFTGKWTRVGHPDNSPIIIEEKGEGYDMYNEKTPNQFVTFRYDKDHDLLTAEQNGATIDMKYVDSSKHLLFSPRNKGMYDEPMELEKVK